MENDEVKALKDATDHMCRLFGKHPELGRQAQIFDVLHACFPQEADVFVQSILDYREEIAEMEPSVMLLRLRCEGDNAAFNDGFARQSALQNNSMIFAISFTLSIYFRPSPTQGSALVL